MNRTLFIPWSWILILFLSLSVGFLCPYLKSAMASSAGLQHEAVQDVKARGQKTILFTTGFPEITPTYRVYRIVYREAFRRMGYNFQIKYHPDGTGRWRVGAKRRGVVCDQDIATDGISTES